MQFGNAAAVSLNFYVFKLMVHFSQSIQQSHQRQLDRRSGILPGLGRHDCD
jgi:hypothetical protein